MGLLDALRRLLSPGADGDTGADGAGAAPARGDGGEPPDGVELGPVARSYVETGGPPAGAPDPERDGRVNVLVTMGRDPGPEGFVDTEDLERHIEALGGDVEHAHGGGTVSGWVPTEMLAELARGPEVVRVEVTIPDDGPVREDPEFEDDEE
ncbi:MAG: hypothetical protein V5A61_15725 [Haloarculaceae archaeon]|jgi:hypothetical protein